MKVSAFHLFSREGKGNSINGKNKQKQTEEKEAWRSVGEMASFTSAFKMKLGCKSVGPQANKWAEKWQISFSTDKGEAVQIRNSNWNLVYLMLSSAVALLLGEKILVTVATPLKSMALWEAAEKKVNLKLSITQKQGRLHYSAGLWNLARCTLTRGPVQVPTSWQDLTVKEVILVSKWSMGWSCCCLTKGWRLSFLTWKNWMENLRNL